MSRADFFDCEGIQIDISLHLTVNTNFDNPDFGNDIILHFMHFMPFLAFSKAYLNQKYYQI